MRLCWNDSFGGPLKNVNEETARWLYDTGWRVAGVNGGVTEATDAEIERVKRIFDDVGLEVGPYGISASAVRPDPVDERSQKKMLADALVIAGKLGCPKLRYSSGSFHPENPWMHHPENHTQKALDRLVESTKSLVPIAEKAQCMLCPETTHWVILGTVDRMAEFVDRLDSPFVKIIFDPVNHMDAGNVYDSGRWIRCAVATLGDRIGGFHVKDVQVRDQLLVVHIDEAPMGEGLLDHAALIEASTQIAPWKTFSLEHITTREGIESAYHHIQGVADSIGHRWTDPTMTRARWEREHPAK